MNNKMQWDDLKLVLAIARTGSLSGAGRTLSRSHATVFRHLENLEAQIGARLFERNRAGYAPTLAGEEVAQTAARVESEVLAVERRIAGQDLKPSGVVRVTTTDALFHGMLAPVFADFRKAHAAIDLEVVIANHLFDLSRREADVAIRPTNRPPEILVGRKVATLTQAVYGGRDFYDDGTGLETADWVGPDSRMLYSDLEQWMAGEGYDRLCRYHVDSVLGMRAAVAAGAGVGVLPCYLGDAAPGLKRLGAAIPALATDLWLLTHADLRKTARIRAFLDFVAAALKVGSAVPRW